MSIEEEEEALEHTLLVVREVAVFKIPPRSTSGGYKCGEWLQSDKIWSGRLRVVSCSDRCEIRLEDPNSGDLFAACFVNPGQRETAVEPALDSSRYFVLMIEDGTGKHAFIGLGFSERNEAFDFNVALSDHEKYVKREDKGASSSGSGEEKQIDIHPAVNHRLKFVKSEDKGASSSGSGEEKQVDIHPAVNHWLKEGETIRINVKNKPSSGTGMLSSAGVAGGVSAAAKPKALGLAPPPGKIRSPLPPPPNDPVAARIASGHTTALTGHTAKDSKDSFSDFSQIKRNLPTGTGAGTSQSTAAGWAAF